MGSSSSSKRPIARAIRPRRWVCSHCPQKNDPGEKKCSSCGIRRATKRTSLKARCDAMAREIVKARAGGKCERCGAVAPLDWAHIFVRAKHNARWLPENALAMCRPCHTYTGDHPATFMAWLADWKGRDWLEALERKSNERWNRSYPDVLASLKKEEA